MGNKDKNICGRTRVNGEAVSGVRVTGSLVRLLAIISILANTNQAAPRQSSTLTSGSAAFGHHYHYQPAASSGSLYRTRAWSYRWRPAATTGYSYTYNGLPSAHREPAFASVRQLAPLMPPQPIGFHNLRFGPFAFGFGTNQPDALMQPQPVGRPPAAFRPLQPMPESNDQSYPMRSSSSSSSSSPASSASSSPSVPLVPVFGSLPPESSGANSSNRPSSSRPGSVIASGPLGRRLPNSLTGRPRPNAAPVVATQPSTAAPPLPSTLSGALGPAVVNDADIGFDVPATSNSDSSSLAGPTVSRPANSPTAPERVPASASSSSLSY